MIGFVILLIFITVKLGGFFIFFGVIGSIFMLFYTIETEPKFESINKFRYYYTNREMTREFHDKELAETIKSEEHVNAHFPSTKPYSEELCRKAIEENIGTKKDEVLYNKFLELFMSDRKYYDRFILETKVVIGFHSYNPYKKEPYGTLIFFSPSNYLEFYIEDMGLQKYFAGYTSKDFINVQYGAKNEESLRATELTDKYIDEYFIDFKNKRHQEFSSNVLTLIMAVGVLLAGCLFIDSFGKEYSNQVAMSVITLFVSPVLALILSAIAGKVSDISCDRYEKQLRNQIKYPRVDNSDDDLE